MNSNPEPASEEKREWRVAKLPNGSTVEYVHASLIGVQDDEVVCEVTYTIDGAVNSTVVRFKPDPEVADV